MKSSLPQISPLFSFVTTLSAMGKNRRMLLNAFDGFTAAEWQTFLDDLEMLNTEKVIVGLRTAWVRRVAVPIFQAHREIGRTDKSPREKFDIALEILKQCQDEKLRKECEDWINQLIADIKQPASTGDGQ